MLIDAITYCLISVCCVLLVVDLCYYDCCFIVYIAFLTHSLTHSLAPYHLEVALAARLIISLCPFPRAFPAVVCIQKIGTDVPKLVPFPLSTSSTTGRTCACKGCSGCARFVFKWLQVWV